MGINLANSFIDLIKQMNAQAYENEEVLSVEESAVKIANLQGYLAGVRKYKALLEESGYELEIKYEDTTERGYYYFDDEKNCNLNLSALREAIEELNDFTETESWENFTTLWQQTVDTMKDNLFYLSEKSRDLHFCKGWYKAMKQMDEYMDALNRQLEYLEQEKANSLPFDEDEEETTPESIGE